MIQASQRRARGRRRSDSKRRIYLVTALLAIIIVVSSGWYIYVYPHRSGNVTTSSSTGNGIIYAKLNTSLGVIEVELYNNSAPKTVTNFVHLTQTGFYDNLVWHRIVKGFVIQTGDPSTRNGGGDRSTWGQGGSPQTVPLEIDPTLHHAAGYLGMARTSDPNSGSSQFFINLADNSASLDGKYTVFGKVISGMDVAVAIGDLPVNSADQPLQNVFLTGVTIQSTP